MRIQVYASEKVRPAFELLEKLEDFSIDFTDWSMNPARLLKNLKNMRNADLVYFHSPTNPRILMMPLAWLMRKPVILQWIGSDVLTITYNDRRDFYDLGLDKTVPVKEALLSGLTGLTRFAVGLTLRNISLFRRYLMVFVTSHSACAQHLIEDLKIAGIDAGYLPVLNHIEPRLAPLPSRFAFLTYTGFHDSSDKSNFYGWQCIIRLAKDFPDTPFYVIGRGAKHGDVPENIILLGFVEDITSIISKVNCLLRITYHDGMPRLLLEALSMGRHVIYTQEFPHTRTVADYSQLHEAAGQVMQESGYNMPGYEFMKSEFNMQMIARQYRELFCKYLPASIDNRPC